METAAISIVSKRERLHHFIEEMEDKRADSLYELFKTEIESEQDFVLTDELKTELDQIDDDLDNGRMYKFISQEQFRNYVKEKMNGQ